MVTRVKMIGLGSDKKHIHPPQSIQKYLKPETMASKIVLIAFCWGEKVLLGWIQWSYERNAVG